MTDIRALAMAKDEPEEGDGDVPRIRTLKPEALQHRKVGRLSHPAFRLWVGCLTQADDAGRLVADANQLKLLVFGYHDRVKVRDVEGWLNEIAGHGLIRRYEKDGNQYVDFPSWTEHQRIDRPRESVIPPFDEHSTNGPRTLVGDLDLDRKDRIGSERRGVALRATARDLLDFLNLKAGRSFRPVEENLRFIEARLKAGATVENLRGVIARKVREWAGDPKMAKFLRPETLFNATKFESYLGERPRVPDDAGAAVPDDAGSYEPDGAGSRRPDGAGSSRGGGR